MPIEWGDVRLEIYLSDTGYDKFGSRLLYRSTEAMFLWLKDCGSWSRLTMVIAVQLRYLQVLLRYADSRSAIDENLDRRSANAQRIRIPHSNICIIARLYATNAVTLLYRSSRD